MSDLNDIINELSDIGEDLTDDINDIVRQVLQQEVNIWRQRAPRDTGALQQSIQLRLLDPYTWGIEFLDYGLYQNFGVRGTESDPGAFSASGSQTFGTPYQFKSKTIGGPLPFAVRQSIARYGLKPQPWFLLPGETVDLIADRVARAVEQRLQLL